MSTQIAPTMVRYIKLGAGNRWLRSCIENQRMELGHPTVPHEHALAANWDAILSHQIEQQGRDAGTAKDFVREARDFYMLGDECLWITFAEGRLWWAFSEPHITWLGGDGKNHGYRSRPTIGPWQNTNISGAQLKQIELSTRLTQVTAYRQTICRIQDDDYVIRKINGDSEPIVARAKAAEAALVDVATEMISKLHWRDFELLVDLIFAHSGWRRISELGGTMKDIDLALEQPATGERAFVQVKSKANGDVFADYVQRFNADPTYDRMFFVCHTPQGTFESRPKISVWTGSRLAQMAVKAGLFDWVVARIA